MAVYLELQNVCARFPLIGGAAAKVHGGKQPRRRERRVSSLKDISLLLRDGARIGVIGPNGAGKTTLLRVMGGLLPYHSGRILRNGHAHALLSPHAGFVAQATGLENIYLRGLLLGLSREQIKSHLDEMIDFAGIGDWIYEPLSTYSAGMALRLAFAVCMTIPPEILLVDEWISAGDARFLRKARDRLTEVIQQTRILVLASHTESILREFCDEAIVLLDGAVVFHGAVQEALAFYGDIVTINEAADNEAAIRLTAAAPAPSLKVSE